MLGEGGYTGADPACIRRLLSRKAAALLCCQPVCISMPMIYLCRVAYSRCFNDAALALAVPFEKANTPLPFLNEQILLYRILTCGCPWVCSEFWSTDDVRALKSRDAGALRWLMRD